MDSTIGEGDFLRVCKSAVTSSTKPLLSFFFNSLNYQDDSHHRPHVTFKVDTSFFRAVQGDDLMISVERDGCVIPVVSGGRVVSNNLHGRSISLDPAMAASTSENNLRHTWTSAYPSQDCSLELPRAIVKIRT